MMAFAANSILTRMAIDGGHIDPSGFAILRVGAGAVVLGAVVLLRGGGLPLLRRNRLPGAVSLAAYVIGFSLAYLTLDAGLGALILFGVVQIAMFAFGALTGAAPDKRQLSGAGIAFAGLLIALWPEQGSHSDPIGYALMVVAGLGWAAYTVIGARAADPLAATAANFILCLPIVGALLVWSGMSFSPTGIALGVTCGGVTSGLGYALWYHVLRGLDPATPAIVQLSVPVLAILGGVLLLGESVGLPLIVATALVIGGIAWGITGRARIAPTR